MIRNYFILYRCAIELNDILINNLLFEVYTQEKNKIFIRFGSGENTDRHLILSLDSSLPYFLIKKEHFKAKKNTVNFFEDYLPSKIIGIEAADRERVIKIVLESCDLYYILRGSISNFIAVDRAGSIFSFFKETESELLIKKNELGKLIFFRNITNPSALLSGSVDNLDFSGVKKLYPFLGKEIFDEYLSRTRIPNNDAFIKIIPEIISEIFSEVFIVFFSKINGKPILCPKTFNLKEQAEDYKEFESYNSAIEEYLSLYFRIGKSQIIAAEIEHYLEKELIRLSTKLNNLKKRVDEGSKEAIYNKYANLLLINRSKLKKGMKKISLSDPYEDYFCEIQLDEKFSPQKNIDRYFEKSRDERINFEKSKELFFITEKKYEKLLLIKKRLERELTVDGLNQIKKELSMKENTDRSDNTGKIRFRHFTIYNKFDIYVGKDSASNDLLTTQFAKQNDYWFHARGLPGSHVILRVHNQKEGIPKNILKAAASIAAFFSKGKTAGTTPVSYTFKKYVYKKKGLEPGQVILAREEVLLVKPEIPSICEELSVEN